MSKVRVHGHAIISDDDVITGPDGRTPPALNNDADWTLFQRALDASDLTVLGRLGHVANPNFRRRRRLVVSRALEGLGPREDAWWWNPADVRWAEVTARLLPGGGLVAVPGGQGVFDLFLALGYDEFHLVRAHGVLVPGGRRLFSGLSATLRAEQALASTGLKPGPIETIDAAANVTRTIWRA
jgi:hypothetical protein